MPPKQRTIDKAATESEKISDSIMSAKARGSIAVEAVTLVYGPRQDDYGPVVSCFDRTAKIINAIKDKDDPNEYTGKDVALIMMAMKLARRQYHYKRDNLVDLIGYADLLEVFEQQKPLV